MAAKRKVTIVQIDGLPTNIHKEMARYLILVGEWELAAPTSGDVSIKEM
jgi:hypothetical protein